MNKHHLYSAALCLGLLIGFIFMPNRLRAQNQLVLRSPLIPAPDTVWVFTPSNYDKSQTSYPAVYLLHGYAGSYHQWSDITNVQKLADKFGFVIVCPDAFYDSWYLDSPIKADHQYESFFFNELMPEINRRYKINEKQVFITGLSMGGHGALYLFSQRPDRFLSAGSTSGVVNLAAVDTAYGLEKLLGEWPEHRKRWKRHSVVKNMKSIKASGKKIIFDVGRGDPFLKMNKALNQKVDSVGIKATFIIRPGGHTYKYWKKSIPYHFFFFKYILKQKNK